MRTLTIKLLAVFFGLLIVITVDYYRVNERLDQIEKDMRTFTTDMTRSQAVHSPYPSNMYKQ